MARYNDSMCVSFNDNDGGVSWRAKVARLENERDKLISDKSALVEALKFIKQIRRGLDLNHTEEEAVSYWANMCFDYRRVAKEALEKVGEK